MAKGNRTPTLSLFAPVAATGCTGNASSAHRHRRQPAAFARLAYRMDGLLHRRMAGAEVHEIAEAAEIARQDAGSDGFGKAIHIAHA